MDQMSDLKPLQDRLTSSLLDVTRKAGQISTEDLSFHRSSSNSLSRNLDAQNGRLLQLTQRLLEAATTTESNVKLPKPQDCEELDDNWRGLVDVIDDLLEHADACLDEYTGAIKRMSPAAQDPPSASTSVKEHRFKSFPPPSTTRQLAKPQLLFDRPPANHDATPFKPLLRTKPNAIIELQESINRGEQDGYNHPYAPEIERFSYLDSVHTSSEPIPYAVPNETVATFVDTKEGLHDMLAELRNASEIAIDLEHHDLHSYHGIVCLMQISTRQKDWIIDTLVPWREDVQVLNEVFTNPKILKVLQGSSMDIIWLQRDLGLYIVGLFDIFHASSALGFPQKSLKYLLRRFCGFEANKQHQMADWRMRPLPQELLDYARSDTHYLLFVYDHLRNLLLEASTPDNSLIDYVLEKSKREALQRYDRPVYDENKGLGPTGWFTLLTRRSTYFNPGQFAVFRAVHQWRDKMARESDEGLASIMTQATLFGVAKVMPTTVHGLFGVTRQVSPTIKDSSLELVKIIKTAQEHGKQGPTLADVMRENDISVPRRMGHHQPVETQQDQGVASTLQRLNESGDVDSKAVRAMTSQFWGSNSTPFVATPSQSLAPFHDALQLVLPLPVIDSASFSGRVPTDSTEQAVEEAIQVEAPRQTSEVTKSPDIFTLKALGRTSGEKFEGGPGWERNFGQPTNEPKTATKSYPEPQTERLTADLSITKSGRKEAKRQKTREAQEGVAKAGIRPEPFDYTNAESILYTKQGTNGTSASLAGPRKFNPAAKALDAPRGMKRARQEAGRSFTFKK